MKTYRVLITETLKKTVEVEAPDRAQAERMVAKQWRDGEHILDADHFFGVSFKAMLHEREHGAR